ncbi:hypothetical protein AB6A40_000050 [Gnathostoma spinigerum]|uniref:Uncharacterized protein n=1 Tax=Gnathostoma spinigerum TaxID=75299 RepID=A0ABD6E2J6_9BILA
MLAVYIQMSAIVGKAMIPQNLAVVEKIRFVPHFVSLRISWTHNSLASQGVERFVDEMLPRIRENNSQIKYYLHRTHTECDPFVVGEYKWLRFVRRRCAWKTIHQVLAAVEEMSVGGDFRPGRKRGVQRRLPRCQELWDTETMGHDVFKVLSKWKGDPPNPDEIHSLNHPHLIHRK